VTAALLAAGVADVTSPPPHSLSQLSKGDCVKSKTGFTTSMGTCSS